MRGRTSWAVVKDSLTTPTRLDHVATVKQSLTVQVEPGRVPTAEKSSVVRDCLRGKS